MEKWGQMTVINGFQRKVPQENGADVFSFIVPDFPEKMSHHYARRTPNNRIIISARYLSTVQCQLSVATDKKVVAFL